jgi:putative hydrolase of the HAD superfamily
VQSLIPDTLALFDAQVLSFQVGFRKPSEVFFQQAISAAGGDAADCLYVDDREDFAAAAEALGMTAVVYRDSAIPGPIGR